MSTIYDVAVIGAGVTGGAIARELSQYKLNTVILEANIDVAMGASGANSAIVHAGYDCVPGTLMAKLNVEGNFLYDQWCRELDVPLKRCGSLVIGFNDEEKEIINNLFRRGIENGVPQMKILTGEEAREKEPMLSDKVTCALWAGTGAITCPYEMTIAMTENAVNNGCELKTEFKVISIEKNNGVFTVKSENDEIKCRYIVNAAGVFADDTARLIGDSSFTISPRKGEYLLMDRDNNPVKTVIFQTPTKLGKGILVSPTVDGNTFSGPTAIDTNDKTDKSVSQDSINTLKKEALKSVPALNFRAIITQFAGIRAQPTPHDFIIRSSDIDKSFIHAAGICSPGLTSAPAIAKMTVSLLKDAGLELTKNESYNPCRTHIKRFKTMTEEERIEAVKNNPLYGQIVCRCETVTEAEIVEAIRRGAKTLDGVKRRTRAGMGRCQGGFCQPRVMEIIARETNIPMSDITKFGGGSYIALGHTKEAL